MSFTMADYEQARAELAEEEAKWDSYTGNNPEKWQARRRDCRERLRLIEDSLKHTGVLTFTDAERRQQTLDQAFPNAKSKDVVTFEGKRYQLKFTPTAWSRSRKNVTEWRRSWEETE